MAWINIMQGANRRYYLGSTAELGRRLVEHRRGHTHTTKRLGGDLRLVASLELPTLEEARALERALKRKKNLQLALYLLQQLRHSHQSVEQPRTLSGLVLGSSPSQPTTTPMPQLQA